MINGASVTSAICRKLHAAYPDYTIYREHVSGELDEPSFFVSTENVVTGSLQNNRVYMMYHAAVSFFPKRNDDGMYETLVNMGISLLHTLFFIDLPIIINGEEMTLSNWAIDPTFQIVDDNMLSFTCQFRIEAVVGQNDEIVEMNELTINQL